MILRKKILCLIFFGAFASWQLFISFSAREFYPFSPYRMFSKNWKSGITMDRVIIFDPVMQRYYRPWDLLGIPFFQANHMCFVTFLDPTSRDQKQALCGSLMRTLSKAHPLSVISQEVKFELNKQKMTETVEKNEPVWTCQPN